MGLAWDTFIGRRSAEEEASCQSVLVNLRQRFPE